MEDMYAYKQDEYGYEHKLIRGYIQDKKRNPIKGAVVILEKIQPEYCGIETEHEDICIDYMVTNRQGEYCFVISDITSYYKIKVFTMNRSFFVCKGED
jgi:hypothetical protein